LAFSLRDGFEVEQLRVLPASRKRGSTGRVGIENFFGPVFLPLGDTARISSAVCCFRDDRDAGGGPARRAAEQNRFPRHSQRLDH
jgi:hypothetical protein